MEGLGPDSSLIPELWSTVHGSLPCPSFSVIPLTSDGVSWMLRVHSHGWSGQQLFQGHRHSKICKIKKIYCRNMCVACCRYFAYVPHSFHLLFCHASLLLVPFITLRQFIFYFEYIHAGFYVCDGLNETIPQSPEVFKYWSPFSGTVCKDYGMYMGYSCPGETCHSWTWEHLFFFSAWLLSWLPTIKESYPLYKNTAQHICRENLWKICAAMKAFGADRGVLLLMYLIQQCCDPSSVCSQRPLLLLSNLQGGRFVLELTVTFPHNVSCTVIHGCILRNQTPHT